MSTLNEQWSLSMDIKKKYMATLVPELKLLRARAGISQDELAGLLSISRQTYCQVENGTKEMSWKLYLSLIFLFDSIKETSTLLSLLNLYPDEFVGTINKITQERG